MLTKRIIPCLDVKEGAWSRGCASWDCATQATRAIRSMEHGVPVRITRAANKAGGIP